jgi:hypothetical protein
LEPKSKRGSVKQGEATWRAASKTSP